MVVIVLPATALAGVTQERIAWPSSCTVHAPQSALPQPNLVPVMPSTSRSTHSIGVSSSTSTVRETPLTVIAWGICHSLRRSVPCPCCDRWLEADPERANYLDGQPRSRLEGVT